MSIKNKSIYDIDFFLRNECDLGYLLDYLNQRKTARDPYWLPVIDVLRFFPEFEIEVVKIRKELKIYPQKNVKCLESSIGIKNFLKKGKQISRGLRLAKLKSKKSALVNKHIKKLVEQYSPELTKRASKIRLSIFGKLQPFSQNAIERYILLGVIDIAPLIFRRSTPEIKVKTNPKTKELYVEMRIYANTNISDLKRIKWWKKIQQLLPNYIYLEKWDEDTILKRFFHYILRTKAGLQHKRIYEWLKEKGFITTQYQYASQELDRFEKLLKKSPLKNDTAEL